MRAFLCLLATGVASGFVVPPSQNAMLKNNYSRIRLNDATAADATTASLEPKELVKLFGRLAEKYIMLDSSGGMCCYSGCKGTSHGFAGGGLPRSRVVGTTLFVLTCLLSLYLHRRLRIQITRWRLPHG
jgi:hypothetical protein